MQAKESSDFCFYRVLPLHDHPQPPTKKKKNYTQGLASFSKTTKATDKSIFIKYAQKTVPPPLPLPTSLPSPPPPKKEKKKFKSRTSCLLPKEGQVTERTGYIVNNSASHPCSFSPHQSAKGRWDAEIKSRTTEDRYYSRKRSTILTCEWVRISSML